MKLLVALSAMDDRVSVRVSISTAILVAEHLNEMSVVSVFSYRDAFLLFLSSTFLQVARFMNESID